MKKIVIYLILFNAPFIINAQTVSERDIYNLINYVYKPKEANYKKVLLSSKNNFCCSQVFLNTALFDRLLNYFNQGNRSKSEKERLLDSGKWVYLICQDDSFEIDDKKLGSFYDLTNKSREEYKFNDLYTTLKYVVANGKYWILVNEFYGVTTARLFYNNTDGDYIFLKSESSPLRSAE